MNDIVSFLEEELSKIYEAQTINGISNFTTDDAIVRVSYVEGLGGIIVEYAENQSDAENNRYEDGDVHKGDDKEQILKEILEEIKG